MHPFRRLLLISLGRFDHFDKNPTPRDWSLMFKMARQQAMLGVLYEGILRLPEGQRPQENILGLWKKLAELIAEKYHKHEEQAKELEKVLERMGLHGCILKGTGLSRLYPVPERRMCGDIDLWIKGTHEEIIDAFRKEGHPLRDVIYQESKVDIFKDTEVEVHFHASKMYCPSSNEKLQKYLEENSPISDNAFLTYPSTKFNAVYCMSHMFHHYLEGGIGMRQMLDYYYILKNLDPSLKETVYKDLEYLGMARFTGAVMDVLCFNFGLEKEYLLCEPDEKNGKKLTSDIIGMGNFGILDKRNYTPKGESSLARFIRKNKRILSNLRYYPKEVIWAPYAKVHQYLWRKSHGYLNTEEKKDA